MLRLTLNELVKIFHKKSIFILWGIMFGFCLLNNVLYQTDYDEEGNYKYKEKEDIKEEIVRLQNELSQYDLSNMTDFSIYVSLKTKLELYQIKQQFSSDSWQYHKVEDYLYELVYQKNYYSYQEQNEELLKKIKLKIQKNCEDLKNNNWFYFLQLEVESLKEEKEEYQTLLKDIESEEKKLEYLERLEEIGEELKILKYRMEKQILEDDSYLNHALLIYQETTKSIRYYENLKREKTEEENYQYLKTLASNKINQYIIEQGQNLNKENTLNYQLRTIVEDYELFIVLLVLMVSAIVVCDEFHSGTIKLLLIKPYSRCKILLSKYFATIFVMMITILILIIVQILIGGIILGVDSLTDPVIVFCYDTKNLLSYSVFEYMWIRLLSRIPFLLILSLIGIGVGVLMTNTVVAVMLPLILYLFAPTIQTLAIEHHLKYMRYLISMNWDFQNYLFGGVSQFSYVNFRFSCLIWIVYFVFISILTLIVFQKKNIKNV